MFFSEDLKPNNMTIVSPTQAKMTTSGSERLLILEPCLSSKFCYKNRNTNSKKMGCTYNKTCIMDWCWCLPYKCNKEIKLYV